MDLRLIRNAGAVEFFFLVEKNFTFHHLILRLFDSDPFRVSDSLEVHHLQNGWKSFVEYNNSEIPTTNQSNTAVERFVIVLSEPPSTATVNRPMISLDILVRWLLQLWDSGEYVQKSLNLRRLSPDAICINYLRQVGTLCASALRRGKRNSGVKTPKLPPLYFLRNPGSFRLPGI